MNIILSFIHYFRQNLNWHMVANLHIPQNTEDITSVSSVVIMALNVDTV